MRSRAIWFYVLGLWSLVLFGAGHPLAALQENAHARSTVTLDDERVTVNGGLQDAPLMFIENIGQFGDDARFQVNGSNGTLWLANDALWITVVEQPAIGDQQSERSYSGNPSGRNSETEKQNRRIVNLRVSFPNANSDARLEPFDRLETTVSYFLGNDPESWRTAVPVWCGVRYVDIYPGIDLEVTGAGGRFEPRLHVHAGADLSSVQLRIEGASAIELGSQDLHLRTAAGDFILPLLSIVESDRPLLQENLGEATLRGNTVMAPFSSGDAATQTNRLQMGNTDGFFGAFLGGSGTDRGTAIAVDGAGAMYVTGSSTSSDFPTSPGAYDTSLNGDTDAYIVKLGPNGDALTYATYLGGSAFDWGHSLKVDGEGSVYLTGSTMSSDFPVTVGAYDISYNGNGDIFVVKLGANGSSLTYATFLGGTSPEYSDYGGAIAIDSAGAAYVTGTTDSIGFPTTPGAYDTTYNGSGDTFTDDVFVTKLSPDGSALVYSTFLGGSAALGGSGEDRGYGIAVDETGAAYVAGETRSKDFPTTPGAYSGSYNGPTCDAFIAKFDPTGSSLVYSTYLGGFNDDRAMAIALDDAGAAYVTGFTRSTNYPTTPGAYDTTFNGGVHEGFVTKLAPDGDILIYSTFLGGSGDEDRGWAIATDDTGATHVAGWTESPEFATTPDAYDSTYNGDGDAFVVEFDPEGATLVYSSFLGGSSHDSSSAIAVDSARSVYITGSTYSTEFPTSPGAFDTTHNGDRDAFVVKVGTASQTPAPVLNTIVNADGDGDYTVSWSIVSVATGYTLQEATDSGFSDATTAYSGNGTSTAISSKAPGTYYYRVRASSASDDSFWSNTQSVMVVALPTAPTLNAIANADGDGNYSVSWSAVGVATSYTLQEATNSGFSDAATTYSGNGTLTDISGKTPGTYFYRVRSHNIRGDSLWSGTQMVTVTEITEGDSYELDDTCTQARVIPTDGAVQERTFHQQADADWVVFTAIAGVEYRIEAQVPPGSPTDVTLELYGQCAGLPLESQNYAFAAGVRLDFESPTSGPLYLRWTNSEAAVYGADVAYHISVRALATEPTPGALIIVAGKLKPNDLLQPNIHYAANQVYQLFQTQGYDATRIYYLATDLSLPGVDALATTANLQAALTTWAVDKVGSDRALTLYLVDHGLLDQLYLDKPAGQWVTPEQLDIWLTQLETVRPGVKVNVIIEACHAGSFIHLPQTVSRSGRVVIASTGAYNLAHASPQGAVFSDYFGAALGQGESLYAAFQTARWATMAVRSTQTPWLDANGNGIPNEPADAEIAAVRGFAYAGTLSGDQWPPYVVTAIGPSTITQGQGIIRAEVRDDEQVRRVWAVVYPPSYTPPQTGEELVSEVLPSIVLAAQGNGQYAATYTGFDETGTYRVVVYAEDNGGREARPVAIEVQTGWAVYLPVVIRQ